MKTPAGLPSETRQVIPVQGFVMRWIEPWYGAYAILGALASGFAALLIPIIIHEEGGSGTHIGAAVAAQNIGVLSAPLWGVLADRTRAYRAIFFSGFVVIGIGSLAFSLISGIAAWIGSALLIGLGIGASNTVASLFVVEFNPRSEWNPRIAWLQTFNAGGSLFGMAAAGVLAPQWGMQVAALLAVPAIALGGHGLPVPGGRLHIPRLLLGDEIRALVREGGPGAATLLHHHWRPPHLAPLLKDMGSPFAKLLIGWFAFSLGVSAFFALYPVLMQNSFAIPIEVSASLMSVATALSLPLYNVSGRWATRHGATFVLGVGYALRLSAMAGLAAIAYIQPASAFWAACVLYGVFQGLWPVLSVASTDLAAELAPFGQGAAIGLFNAIAAIASAAGAVAGGLIADRVGNTAVPLFAALAIAAALLMLSFTRPSRADAAAPPPPSPPQHSPAPTV